MRSSMHLILLALLAFVTAQNVLECDLDSITNEISTQVVCTYPPSLTVSDLRTMLYTPTKRSSKFYSNITHNHFEGENGILRFQVVYSLPLKEFDVSVSAKLHNPENGEQVWESTEPVRMKIADPPAGLVPLLSATIMLSAFITFFTMLVYKVLPPSTRRGLLPGFLQPYFS